MPDIINTLGTEWGLKWFNRTTSIREKDRLVNEHLSEYLAGKKHCLDLACGNGTLLEVLRYYGNDIMGTERSGCDCVHLIRAQNVPLILHDCDRIPYPFESKSYDLVTLTGVIHAVKIDWELVLDEIFRIARKTVFITINSGQAMNESKHKVINYEQRGWVRTGKQTESMHKWTYCG